jgi:ABC-type branched-subunit amino acid transport system permease subunit
VQGRWSWAGAAILVLATFLGGGWATALIMSASSRTPPITDSTKDLLSSVGGVLAGAITAYIGGMIATRRKDDDDEDDDEHDTSDPPDDLKE